MKKIFYVLSVFSLLLLYGCNSSAKLVKNPNDSKGNVSFKAREYYLKGIFLQAEERFSEALVQFHKAQIFDTTSATIHNSLAENYFKLNDFEPALYHLKKAAHLAADNIETHRLFAEVYFRQRKDSEAIHAYEQILKLDPFDDNARNFLFFLYEKTKQPAAKVKLYEDLLYLYGNDKVILLQIADAYEQQEDLNKAIYYLNKVIDIDSLDYDVFFNHGTLLERLDHFDEAIQSYQRAYRLAPHENDVIGRLAILYRSTNQYKKTIDILEPAIIEYPDNIGFKLILGECYYLTENPDKTRELLTPLSLLNTSPWTVYDLLGRIELEDKNYEQAINYFQKVITINEKNYFGWLFLGFTYIDMNKFSDAENNYRKAVTVLPDETSLWTWLGISLQRQRKYNDAIIPFTKAISLDDKNVNALSSLPVVLEELNMFSKSDSIYQIAVQNLPENALLLNNFAYSLSERNIRLEEALAMSEKSNLLEPDNAAYLDTIGWIYFKLKNYEEAKIYIHKSINSRPNSAVVLDHLGDVYYEMGDISEAKKYWKKSIELQPDNQTVLEKIANN